MLPETASMQIPFPPSGGGLAYFPQVIVTNGGVLNGTYLGWCLNPQIGIQIGPNIYPVAVYSSYEPIPAGLVDYPDNLDLINWILNQDYVNKQSICGGKYTYGDVQRAIWELLFDDPNGSGLGDWSQCRVDEITSAASANGEGFEPECGDKIAIILDPGNRQPVIIEIDIPCGGDETAWGNGIPFSDRDWSMYLHWQPS
jgi:hypothetical protein